MSNVRRFAKYWLPVLIWMVLIFSASGDTQSYQHSSRIIEPLLRWLFPHISTEAVNQIVFAVRKCAHVTEYAVLGLLFWRALRQPSKSAPRPWSWRLAGWSVALAFLYAATDELHQRFVRTRDASVRDVLLDTSGAVLGILAIYAIGRWRKRWT